MTAAATTATHSGASGVRVRPTAATSIPFPLAPSIPRACFPDLCTPTTHRQPSRDLSPSDPPLLSFPLLSLSPLCPRALIYSGVPTATTRGGGIDRKGKAQTRIGRGSSCFAVVGGVEQDGARSGAWPRRLDGQGKPSLAGIDRSMPPSGHRQESGCGCWAVLTRGLRGSCFRPAAAADTPAGAAVKGDLVHDAAEMRYLNGSNRDLGDQFERNFGDENGVNASTEKKTPHKLLEFTFQELKSATVNFRPDSILGEGGFGYVFKGWIEPDSTAPAKPGTGLTVAVKSLKENALQGHREWVAEVDFLGQLHHKHLVKLIGYCIEDEQRLLVYEFMARGSLENHLFRRTLPLPWPYRMKVVLGAAKGLAFLHVGPKPVIYRDFKTSNILIDVDYNAKLSDFGLAKAGPQGDKSHVSTRVLGTYGYAAPEYVMTGHLTTKSDVYSFGVVLLEVLTGRRSIDKKRLLGEQNLVAWARPYLSDRRRLYQLVDPRLGLNYSIRGVQKVAQICHHCLNRDSKSRPMMDEVIKHLTLLQDLNDMAAASYRPRSSPRGKARR